MAFDIATQVAPNLNTGSFLHLTDPHGAPLYDEGKPVGIVMCARNSVKGLAQMRANANQRMNDARRGLSSGVERNEADSTEVLVACTVSWTFDEFDGQPFAFNADNARKLWGDDRFRRWREQADDFISSEANFMKA